MQKARGFTLIELVALIVLIGILSIFVAPRFSGTGSFAEKTVRDRMVAIARYAQQRAMTDQTPNVCYRFHIQSEQLPPAVQSYGAQRSVGGGAWVFIGPANSDRENSNNLSDGRIALADNVTIANTQNNNTISIFFDGLGNPVNGCGGSVITPPVITIIGEFPQTITISGAGYVRGS